MAVKYHGKRGVVYVSPDGTTAASNAAGLRAFTLDLTTDLVDVTEFLAGNKTFVPGFPNYTGTIEGFYATDVTVVSAAATATVNGTGTNIYLYPSADAVSKYIGGPAWLSLQLRSAVDAAVTQNANFSARGTWVNAL